MKRLFLLAVVVVVSFSLIGCAVFETKDIGKLKSRVNTLEEKQSILEKRVNGEPVGVVYPPEEELVEATDAEIEAMTKKDIQRALSNAGYYDGPIDGKIGTNSRKAIRDFQESKGLKIDGIPGPQTKKALMEYLIK